MNLIVLDLEWNQAPNVSHRNPIVPFEIIEIGAIKLNMDFKKIDQFCEVIKPVIYKKMHVISREITHISNASLRNGRGFKEVFNDFIKWCGDDYMICTWGCTDITELQRNMKYHGFPLFKAPVLYYDIQKIFSLVYEEDKKVRRSLQDAVEFLSIRTNIPFHRALSDAIYTAEVIRKLSLADLTNHYSVDYYQKPQSKKQEFYFDYEDYSKYVSREFEVKTDIMSDKQATTINCLKCGRACRKKVRWFSGNSKIYYALGVCPEHGFIRSKLRVKKGDSGQYFAVKTSKFVDDKGLIALREKQADIRKKRKLKRKKEEEAN